MNLAVAVVLMVTSAITLSPDPRSWVLSAFGVVIAALNIAAWTRNRKESPR